MKDDKLSKLADLINELTYREMARLSDDLARMIEPDVRTAPRSASDFASILSDWAEAQE